MNAIEKNTLTITLSKKDTIALLLRKEDIKCQKFFSGLRDLGLDDSENRPELSEIILSLMGLNAEEDRVNDFYYNLINQYSKKVRSKDQASQNKYAFKAYAKLKAERFKILESNRGR